MPSPDDAFIDSMPSPDDATWYVDCFLPDRPDFPVNSYGPMSLVMCHRVVADTLGREASGIGTVTIGRTTKGMSPMPVPVRSVARPETGPMRFGDDWTGVFLRGDDAGPHAMYLEQFLETPDEPLSKMMVGQLVRLLQGCDERGEEARGAQRLQPFEQCVLAPNSTQR